MNQRHTHPTNIVLESSYNWLFRRRVIRARILTVVTLLTIGSIFFILLK